MSRISVGLTPALAAAYLRGDPDKPEVRALQESVRRSGGALEPQAPTLVAEDLDVSSDDVVWFTGDVDAQAAADLVSRLLDVADVRAAFVVPPEGPP